MSEYLLRMVYKCFVSIISIFKIVLTPCVYDALNTSVIIESSLDINNKTSIFNMKVHMISRAPGDFMRETKHDIHKVFRNYDRKLHQHSLEREFKRALNSTKLERVFAKPFIGNLSGHGDIVNNLLKHQTRLSIMASGAYDGCIKIWDLTSRKCMRTIQAHNTAIRAMCVSRLNENHFFSVDTQSNIKRWRYFSRDQIVAPKKKKMRAKSVSIDEPSTSQNDDRDDDTIIDSDEDDDDIEEAYDQTMEDSDIPLDTIIARSIILSMDHHYDRALMVTAGDKVDLWEENRNEPLRSWKWGADSTQYVKFNPIEVDMFATSSSDRAITLFDVRQANPLRKVILELKSNQLCWNPMEAFMFTVANEDHDLYSFDMRKLTKPVLIHKDHVDAVIALDYSPTGLEIVSGSYDKSIRIFPSKGGRSRDVYYTKRMQRLTDVIWSNDAKYLVSASDEMDLRMWRANASEVPGPKMLRQQLAEQQDAKLKQKFKNYPDIRRIARHRHVPKHIYHSRKEKREMINSRRRKEANRIAHSRPGTIEVLPEKERHIVREEE